MAHTQKPDFIFWRNGWVHLNQWGGGSFQSTTGRWAVHISLQGLYCLCKPLFCSHVTLTGYPLHSLVSPSIHRPCVTVCHHISNAFYLRPTTAFSENSHSFLLSAQNQFSYMAGHQFMTKAATWQHWRPDLRDVRWRDSICGEWFRPATLRYEIKTSIKIYNRYSLQGHKVPSQICSLHLYSSTFWSQ